MSKKLCFDHVNHKIYKNIQFLLKGEAWCPRYKIHFQEMILVSDRVVSVNIGVADERSAFRIF
jgi:hypothetical protein